MRADPIKMMCARLIALIIIAMPFSAYAEPPATVPRAENFRGVPDGTVLIQGQDGKTSAGYITKNVGGTAVVSWFGVAKDDPVNWSYAEAVKALDAAVKEIPRVASALGKPAPPYLNLKRMPSDPFMPWGVAGQYIQRIPEHTQYDLIYLNPNIKEGYRSQVMRHEIVHWVNGDCEKRPFCEVMTGITGNYFGDDVSHPSAVAQFRKETLSLFGRLNEARFKELLAEYMLAGPFGKKNDFGYVFSDLLGAELASRFVVRPGNEGLVVVEVQKLIDAANAKMEKNAHGDAIRELGFSSFDELNTALQRRFMLRGDLRVQKPAPAGAMPLMPSMARPAIPAQSIIPSGVMAPAYIQPGLIPIFQPAPVITPSVLRVN